MPKKDWTKTSSIFKSKNETYLKEFLSLNEVFLPNDKQKNIFDKTHNAFSAKHLKKASPANWIPIYNRNDLSEYLLENSLMPVRWAGGVFLLQRRYHF